MPRRVPDHLVAIQDAELETGISVETLYRWLRAGQSSNGTRLTRIRVPGDKRTFLDREQLAEALKPQAE